MGNTVMAGRDLFGGYTGVIEPSQSNPPLNGGFLQPNTQGVASTKPNATTQDFMTRSDAYDVLIARGRQDLADADPRFEDVRVYRQTGQLPVALGGEQQEQEQEQPRGLFVRSDQPTQEQGTQAQQKPVWDYSNPQFTPIRVKDDADEKRLESEFNGLGEKWSDVVNQAKQTKFTGKNLGNKGDTQWLQQTNNLVPWMFKNIYGLTPDEIVKVPPATRREMISDMLDVYTNSLSAEDRERSGISNDDNFKNEVYKKYGVSADRDEDSVLGGVGTLARGFAGGAINEGFKNPLAIIEAELGDGKTDTGVGKAYKVADALHQWVTEDPNNGQLTAAKMRLQTLLSQDRLGDAISFALSDGELRNSLLGEIGGAIAVDSAVLAGAGAAAGTVIPVAGTAVGGALGGVLGGVKGLGTFYKRMEALYEAAKQAKSVQKVAGAVKDGLAVGAVQTAQSAGTMYSDLLDRDVEITPEVKELVHDSSLMNGLITAVVPGSLEHSTARIAGVLRTKLAQLGKEIPEEAITSSASAIAKQLSKKGVTAADGAIESATPWQRIKGGLSSAGVYVKNAVPEAVQEGLTAYNEDATKRVNQDGSIRELTPEEQQNRVTNALFEGAIGATATVPRSVLHGVREHGETQRLKDAYQSQFAKEKVENDVAQQSDEFKTLYEQAEGTPEQRYQMAQETLAAKAAAEEAIAKAAQREQERQRREDGVTDVQKDFDERIGDLKVQLEDEGLSSIAPTYNPLHNYLDANQQHRNALNGVINDIDNVINKANESDVDSEDKSAELTRLYNLREELKRGDLTSLTQVAEDNELFSNAGVKLNNFNSKVDRLSKLTRYEPVITEADPGVTRFTKSDRNNVVDQLRTIAGVGTTAGGSPAIDPNNLTGSILSVKNRLLTAEDSAAKQKGLEQVSVLERMVNNNLPEGVRKVGSYYKDPKNNERFKAPTSSRFAGENGEALYNQSKSNVEGIVDNLVKQGALNNKTGGRLKSKFNSLFNSNPSVAIDSLVGDLSSIGVSLHNNSNTNFLSKDRVAAAKAQTHFNEALSQLSQVKEQVSSSTIAPITEKSINDRLFAQYGDKSHELQSTIGDMVDGIRFALTGVHSVPTNKSLQRDPIGELISLRDDLNGNVYIGAKGSQSTQSDIDQAKAYVDVVLDAIHSGKPIPAPSPMIRYYAEQRRASAEDRNAVIKRPNSNRLTGDTYKVEPLSSSKQGKYLVKAKSNADKVSSAFDVVHTDNGPLVFLNNNELNGDHFIKAMGDGQTESEYFAELASMVTNNRKNSETNESLDGGVTGKQESDIPAKVVEATAEEFSAQNFIKMLNTDDGLIGFVDKMATVKAWSTDVRWDSSLSRAIKTLLVGAKNKTLPIGLPKISLESDLRDTYGNIVKAVYVHDYSGGTIKVNSNLSTDTAVRDAVMHELVHWAISQRQLSGLMQDSPASIQALQRAYLGSNDYNSLPSRLDRAITTEHNSDIIDELKELQSVLNVTGLNDHLEDGGYHSLTDQQIMFEELVAYVAAKDSFTLSRVDLALGLPPTDSLSNIPNIVAKAIEQPFTTVNTGSKLFRENRVTYSNRRKQPTIIRYGFKANNEKVTGDPVAYLDPSSNAWNLYYIDTAGNPHLEENMTFSQLTSLARGLELWPGRIEKEHLIQKAPQKMMSNLQQLSPVVYKFASRINKLLGSQGDHDVRAPVRQIVNFIISQGVRQQGLVSWFNHIENAILNLHGEDVRDQLEARYNDIRQKFQYEISEDPLVGESNINAMQREINKLMRDSGFPQEKIDNMLYALEAEDRHSRILKETPVEPLTGKRRSNSDNLTGFLKPRRDGTGVETDATGRAIDDSDGSKYRSTWTAEDRLFAKSLKKLFTDINNRVLEIEYAAGRMTEKQFKELYGKFYVPLRNEDDGATAFTKKVTGRRTKADSPMTHFQSNMYARLKSAEQSMVMQEVMDTLAKNPVDGFMSFNSTTLTKNQEGKYIQRADGLIKGSTFTFFRDGMKYTAVVDDPVLSRALKAQRDGAEKDSGGLGYMRMISGMTSMLARARTMTPKFFITSIFRDGSTALVNHQAAFRGKSGLTGLEHQALAIKTVAYAAKNLGNMLKWKANPDKADWRYKVYRKYGGIGNSEQFDLDSVRNQIGQNIFDKRGFLSGVKAAGRKYQDIMHASDDLIRFATWLTFLEKKAGRNFTSEDDMRSFLVNNPDISSLATSGSKNITGNFQNKGIGNRFERSHFIFWNATMTGISNVFRMFNPRYGMQGIGAGTTLFTLMFLQGLGAPDDDDDEKSRLFRLKGLGDWVGLGGEGGFAWPLSQELRPISHLAYGLSGVLTDNLTVGQGVKMISDGALQGLSPFTPAQTSDDTFNMLYPFVPTVIQPFALASTDENFFGQPVRPKVYDTEGREITDAPDAIRYKGSDAPWAIEMAHAFYRATDGAVDVLPGSIEEFPRQILGGFYSMYKDFSREYEKTGDAINSVGATLAKGKQVEYNEFAIQENANKRFLELRQKFRVGDSTDDMMRPVSEQPEEYRTILAIEKETQDRIKNLESDGQSLSSINQRIKQLRLDPTSPQELFELQTRAADIYAQRNYIYGEAMRALDELGLD